MRFALTSEAGLNDGLAYPLVYLAVFLAAPRTQSTVEWLGWYVIGRSVIGVAVGLGAGWLLGKMAFSAPSKSFRLADSREPVLALAMTLGVYGLTEVLQGYGFIAVFVAALALRAAERSHEFHAELHSFIGELEHILTWGILLLLGVAITGGLLEPLTVAGAAIGVLLVLVVRPLLAWLSLARLGAGSLRTVDDGGVRGPRRDLDLLPRGGRCGFRDRPALAVGHRRFHRRAERGCSRRCRDAFDADARPPPRPSFVSASAGGSTP